MILSRQIPSRKSSACLAIAAQAVFTVLFTARAAVFASMAVREGKEDYIHICTCHRMKWGSILIAAARHFPTFIDWEIPRHQPKFDRNSDKISARPAVYNYFYAAGTNSVPSVASFYGVPIFSRTFDAELPFFSGYGRSACIHRTCRHQLTVIASIAGAHTRAHLERRCTPFNVHFSPRALFLQLSHPSLTILILESCQSFTDNMCRR